MSSLNFLFRPYPAVPGPTAPPEGAEPPGSGAGAAGSRDCRCMEAEEQQSLGSPSGTRSSLPGPAGEQPQPGPSPGEKGGSPGRGVRTCFKAPPEPEPALPCPRSPGSPKGRDTPLGSAGSPAAGGCPSRQQPGSLPAGRPRPPAAPELPLYTGLPPGRRPGNVPSGEFFCRAPSYAQAALHF